MPKPDNLEKKIDQLVRIINLRLDNVEEGLDSLDFRFQSQEDCLADLEVGQDAILLKLDNYAYKFEVVDLKQRVLRLEKKSRISESV